jgi:hypothetical protein
VSTLTEIVEGLTTALQPLTTTTPDLQLYPYLNINPTPPSIDVYPGDPFQEWLGFDKHGQRERKLFFTVRARVSTADQEDGQKLLLEFLDPNGGVEDALATDHTLGGAVSDCGVVEEGVTGIRQYVTDTPTGQSLLGCEWRVQVLQ